MLSVLLKALPVRGVLPGRLLLFLSVLSTFTSAAAQGAEPSYSWPAFAYQFQAVPQEEGADPGRITVSVVSVPEEAETEFVAGLAKRAAEGRGDRAVIAHTGDAIYARKLRERAAPGNLSDFVVDDPRVFDRRFTLEGVQRAGTWVAIAGTGIAATTLYVSCAIGPATAGALVIAFITTFNVKFSPTLSAWLNRGKKSGEDLAARFGVKRPWAVRAAGEAGSAQSALIYHFVTNSAFTLALNLGDIAKTFGGVDALADLATNTAFNLLSNSMWDFVWARMRAEDPSAEREKVVLLMSYANRIFLMAVGPLLFIPSAHVLGMSILSVYGAIGLYANIRHRELFNGAERVLERMEGSRVVSRALSRLGAFDERVRALSRPLAARVLRAPRCQGLFAP